MGFQPIFYYVIVEKWSEVEYSGFNITVNGGGVSNADG